MAYRAYSEKKGVRVSIENDRESARVRSTHTFLHPPIGESETRDGITEIAYAFLGRDPSDLIYVTDSQNRVLEKVSCEKYRKESDVRGGRLERQGTLILMACYLFFLCLACFLATLVFELQWIGFGLFSFIALFYIAVVSLRIQNEFETALVCTLILLMGLWLGPAIKRARDRAQQARPAEQVEAPEPAAGPVSNGEAPPPIGDADGSAPTQ